MTPDNAKVFVIDDDEATQEIIAEVLKIAGHTVAGIALNLNDALSVIPTLEEKGVQIATVDGNLTKEDASGHDGKTIVAAIRQQAPKVKIIGLTSDRLGVEGADVNIHKRDTVRKLEEVIRDL